MSEQEIRYCTAPDGVRIAYATAGSGPPLVKAANWIGHLEFEWRSPVWRHWLPALTPAPPAAPLRGPAPGAVPPHPRAGGVRRGLRPPRTRAVGGAGGGVPGADDVDEGRLG